MARAKKVIPFFTDQNVPDSVGDALLAHKHHVIRLRDVMDGNTPDPIIAIACAADGQVLISFDKDFRQLSKRLNITQKQYHRSLHRIQMRCSEPNGARRIIEAISVIESEWKLASHSRPMVIEISDVAIRIVR